VTRWSILKIGHDVAESNRRDFFRSIGRRTAREAQGLAKDAAPLLRARSQIAGDINAMLADDEARVGSAEGGQTDTTVPPSRPDASTPTCCLEPEEVAELALAEGLGSRIDEITSLIERSVRVVPDSHASAQVEAWLDLARGLALVEPPGSLAGDPDVVLLAQVAQSAPALEETPLSGSGWLAVFVESVAIEAQTLSPALRANVIRLDRPAAVTPTSTAMLLAPQLLLPRVWSEPVQAMGLREDEHDGYVRLRDRLAERQGVEIEHGGGAARAYHRLLGYPDETTGTMPADCAAAAGEGDWRLLAQVSVGSSKRVYVWIADDGFERAVAFAR
jgi:hypothetical protein